MCILPSVKFQSYTTSALVGNQIWRTVLPLELKNLRLKKSFNLFRYTLFLIIAHLLLHTEKDFTHQHHSFISKVQYLGYWFFPLMHHCLLKGKAKWGTNVHSTCMSKYRIKTGMKADQKQKHVFGRTSVILLGLARHRNHPHQ